MTAPRSLIGSGIREMFDQEMLLVDEVAEFEVEVVDGGDESIEIVAKLTSAASGAPIGAWVALEGLLKDIQKLVDVFARDTQKVVDVIGDVVSLSVDFLTLFETARPIGCVITHRRQPHRVEL